jgi:hypothetical protein
METTRQDNWVDTDLTKAEGEEFYIAEESPLLAALSGLNQLYQITDLMGIIILLGAASAHNIPGEMLWLRVYGGSRAGKTEILRAIARHEDSVEMEAVTPASVRGGLKGGHKLLKRIDKKLVITKDFASILTTRKDARNELAGLLRSVKDGSLTADFGTEEGYVAQYCSFDWLIGTTGVYAQFKTMEDLLGSRYIDLNWRTSHREEMALSALENDDRLNSSIRPEAAQLVACVIDDAKKRPVPVIPDDLKRTIASWADFTARLRTPIARDSQHRIKLKPAPEVGTSLAQNLHRIARSLLRIGIRAEDLKLYLARLCYDCVPYSRIEILKMEPIKMDTSIQWDIGDMKALGILEKGENGYNPKDNIRGVFENIKPYWF